MLLTHFSHKPLTFNPSKVYKIPSIFGLKPNGLWLSDENDFGWTKWCEREGFGPGSFETKFKVDTTNVLVLNTDQKIIDFNTKYSKPRDTPIKELFEIFKEVCNIDWEQVMKEYDGIIISPYSQNLRLKFFWYNPWDCASGCIWNLSCLK